MSFAKKLVVFGGNGYLGQRIVANALKFGIQVISINRSGEPPSFKSLVGSGAKGSVEWHKGDIFKAEEWKECLTNCDGIVSCVGAFGSNEFMERINGDANINAIRVAKEMNVPRFTYISCVENNLPILPGYFNGKRRAEEYLYRTYNTPTETNTTADNNNSQKMATVESVIGGGGTALRPSFVYGTRNVGSIGIPLWLFGKPMEVLFNNAVVQYLRNTVPGMKAILAMPVSVDSVANTALVSALGPEVFGLTTQEGASDKAIKDVSEIQRVGKLMEENIKQLK